MKPIAPVDVERWVRAIQSRYPKDVTIDDVRGTLLSALDEYAYPIEFGSFYRSVQKLTDVGRICPVCNGSLRVPKSIVDDPLTATRWRDCHYCLALVNGQLVTSGVVHVNRSQ